MILHYEVKLSLQMFLKVYVGEGKQIKFENCHSLRGGHHQFIFKTLLRVDRNNHYTFA